MAVNRRREKIDIVEIPELPIIAKLTLTFHPRVLFHNHPVSYGNALCDILDQCTLVCIERCPDISRVLWLDMEWEVHLPPSRNSRFEHELLVRSVPEYATDIVPNRLPGGRAVIRAH